MQSVRSGTPILQGVSSSSLTRHPAVARQYRCPRTHIYGVQYPERRHISAKASLGNASARATAVDRYETPGSSTVGAETFDAACPICLETDFTLNSFAERGTQSPQFCSRCSVAFSSAGVYTDLTLEPPAGGDAKTQYTFGGVQIFRSPLVSWVYERGWRQSFANFGFPGADEETQIALEYLRPAWGDTIMDLSCGSGLFSRRFIKSGKFRSVIVSDFSENMLKQTSSFIDEDPTIDPRKYTLVRMDAGRLPFKTGSLSAIHAGAALHCWPNPALAVAEISRVLKPGGVFVASTILDTSSGIGSIIGDENIRGLKQLGIFEPLDRPGGPYRMWAEEELREICSRMGLTDFKRDRRLRFILFSVTKPKS